MSHHQAHQDYLRSLVIRSPNKDASNVLSLDLAKWLSNAKML